MKEVFLDVPEILNKPPYRATVRIIHCKYRDNDLQGLAFKGC